MLICQTDQTMRLVNFISREFPSVKVSRTIQCTNYGSKIHHEAVQSYTLIRLDRLLIEILFKIITTVLFMI